MRKSFLDNLPTCSEEKSDSINWKSSIGLKINFIYDDITGEIEIIKYLEKSILIVRYNNKDFKIRAFMIKDCKLGHVVGKINHDYLYSVGDTLDDLNSGRLTILEHIKLGKRRGYKYKCLNCGNLDKIYESRLLIKGGCNACCFPSQKVLIGYNDIHSVDPKFGQLLWSFDDGYKYTVNSSKKINFKCPECGLKVADKIITNVYNRGLSCANCSDGLSYPEKFMFNLLKQLHVELETQKSFDWITNRRYDFYISSMNCIIEVHGIQHYNNRGFRPNGEEQIIDDQKKLLALQNGIKSYLVINCSISDLEFIKINIFNSDLSMMFDLTLVNWLKCHEYACSSYVKTACDIWRSGVRNAADIAKIMKIKSSNTIIKYLKRGVELGWCDYDPDEARRLNGAKSILLKKNNVKIS